MSDHNQSNNDENTPAQVPDVNEIAERISNTLSNLGKAKQTVSESETAEVEAVEATKKSRDGYKKAITDALAEGFVTKDLLAKYGHKAPSRGSGKSRGTSVNL